MKNLYNACPHCKTEGKDLMLLKKREAEELFKKEIPHDRILLCPKGCRYTSVER